jgi:hypothetical protein
VIERRELHLRPAARALSYLAIGLLVDFVLVAAAVLYEHSVTLVRVRDIDQDLILHLLALQGTRPLDDDARNRIQGAFDRLANPSRPGDTVQVHPKLGLVLFRSGKVVASNFRVPPAADISWATAMASGGDPQYRLLDVPGNPDARLLVFRHELQYDIEGGFLSRLLIPLRHWWDPACMDVRGEVIWRKARYPFAVTGALLTLLAALYWLTAVRSSRRWSGVTPVWWTPTGFRRWPVPAPTFRTPRATCSPARSASFAGCTSPR